MICRGFWLAIAAIALLLCPLTAAAQATLTIDAVLRDSERVQIMNRLSASDRARVFQAVRVRWAESRNLSWATLLCQVDPWSLGDASDDAALQQELMVSLPASTEPWSSEFAIRDCAAANREGSYFSVIPDQQRNMHAAFIEGDGNIWVQESAEEALSRIRNVDAALLRATRGRAIRSFYPLLNVRHAAEIHAARAVFLAEENPDGANDAL